MSDEQRNSDLSAIERTRALLSEQPPRPFRWQETEDGRQDVYLQSSLFAADGSAILDVTYYDGYHILLPHGASVTGEFLEASGEFAEAALREIDRLNAERDAIRAELAKLRAAIGLAVWNLEESADWFGFSSDWQERREKMRNATAAIRAALESEAGE